jgi:hypothetical protein
MNHRHLTAGLAGLTLLLGFAGCGPKPETPPASETSAAPVADPNAVPLGKPYIAAPFEVTLSSTEAPIKFGDVPFHAEIKRDGAAVRAAVVKLTLSMPGMGMPGPSAPLTWRDGRYSGKVAAGMAGEWQADVAVEDSGTTAKSAFTFHVVE